MLKFEITAIFTIKIELHVIQLDTQIVNSENTGFDFQETQYFRPRLNPFIPNDIFMGVERDIIERKTNIYIFYSHVPYLHYTRYMNYYDYLKMFGTVSIYDDFFFFFSESQF